MAAHYAQHSLSVLCWCSALHNAELYCSQLNVRQSIAGWLWVAYILVSLLPPVLEVGPSVPTMAVMNRWLGEPVKAVILSTELFLENKKGDGVGTNCSP